MDKNYPCQNLRPQKSSPYLRSKISFCTPKDKEYILSGGLKTSSEVRLKYSLRKIKLPLEVTLYQVFVLRQDPQGNYEEFYGIEFLES